MAEVDTQPIVESLSYKVKDVGLANAGRKAMGISEKDTLSKW